MGKKKINKGKGAEKTASKTEKKAQKKAKKLIQEQGEEDIEAMIAQFQAEDKKRSQTIEEKCPPPSRRANMSLTAHPDKDELIIFGGEYFDGSKTLLYNDLFFYNVKTNEWVKTTAPNPPPPRCAHQAVAMHQDGGQLWVFGGEFASPSQSQFYHYRDLWLFSLRRRTWQKVSAPGGPSSRSGHRMVAYKKLLILFAGFHDNIRDYKYYNDVYTFNLETYTWTKLDVSGSPPAPRSACIMAVTGQHKVLVYGGYSKERVKQETDIGKTHTDMFLLTPEGKADKDDTVSGAVGKWKWVLVRQQGKRPSPRSGCTLAVTSNNRAVVFGGVYDEEEDEENINGQFYNDLYDLDMDKGTWHEVQLLGKRDQQDRKRRRRQKETQLTDNDGDKDAAMAEETESEDDADEMDETVQMLKIEEPVATDMNRQPAEEEESVFKVTIGGPSAVQATPTVGGATGGIANVVNAPCRRMNAQMVVKHGVLYLYGGMVESGDRTLTLSDLYALDLRKLDKWRTIVTDETTLEDLNWQDTSSSSDSEDDEDENDEMATAD